MLSCLPTYFAASYIFHLVVLATADYTAVPRWGQATVLVGQSLFIHGGKTEQYNEYSYTTAPNSNDILYLDLSTSFDVTSPPWALVSSSSLLSTSQGPSLAWHTVTAFNTSLVLSFGGAPDANSPIVLPELADSSWLLNVSDDTDPQWINVSHPWADEPLRRMHHTADTLPDGRLLILGGLKTDGSGTVLSDNWLVDITVPTFISFNASGSGPPAIYGHASVILSTGQVVVFGGYSQNSANAFTTIWLLDVMQETPAWLQLTVNGTNIPGSRMSFAVALLSDGTIIIHGGYDNDAQSTLSDGWLLTIDLGSSSASWSTVDALAQLLGPRRDHFAVASGQQVIFGFGYGSNGPADAALQVFSPSSSGSSTGSGSGSSSGSGSGSGSVTGSSPSTYTPPSTTGTLSPTMPGQISNSGTNMPTGTETGVHSTSTAGPGGNGTSDSDGGSNNHKTTVVAVSTAFGALALLAAGCGAYWYARHQQRERELAGRFQMINQDDENDENSPHFDGRHNVPAAAPYNEKSHADRRRLSGVMATLGFSRGGTAYPERRDMLADEDTRQFGSGWSTYSGRRRDGSGGSSWSLMDILGGVRGRMSREASYVSGRSIPESPQFETGDPFTDGAALMKDEETGYVGAVAPAATAMAGIAASSHTEPPSFIAALSRPRGGNREPSYSSARNYADPFADPGSEHLLEPWNAADDDEKYAKYHHSVRAVSAPPPIQTMYPLTIDRHTLSPLSEVTSRLSFDPATSSQSSHDQHSSTLTSHTNITSYDHQSPRSTYIIDANSNRPIQRSDSWWTRFSRTPLLDRRSSTSKQHKSLDIRDPNPPPSRLGAIEEKSRTSGSPNDSAHSNNPTPTSKEKKRSKHLYNVIVHGKSTSSVRTANTDAIERMGAMDVVQRVASDSQRTRSSIGSTISADFSLVDDHGILTNDDEIVASPTDLNQPPTPTAQSMLVPRPSFRHLASSPPEALPKIAPVPLPMTSTPHSVSLASSSAQSLASNGSSQPKSTRRMSGSLVTSRVNAFEQKVAQDGEVLPPTNTRSREERVGKSKSNVTYGLVPRASLYVANPDRGASGDSQ